MIRSTVIPSRGKRKWRSERQVIFFGSEQIDMLLMVRIDDGE